MRYITLPLVLFPIAIGIDTLNYCPRPAPTPVLEVKVDPKELKCLATMIYGEARGEKEIGQVAVAWTARNRATDRRICQIVLAPYQYSAFNDNPRMRLAATNLKIVPPINNILDKGSWEQALKVATEVLKNEVPDPTNGATHYIAPMVMHDMKYEYPDWTKKFKRVKTIYNHVFFRQA